MIRSRQLNCRTLTVVLSLLALACSAGETPRRPNSVASPTATKVASIARPSGTSGPSASAGAPATQQTLGEAQPSIPAPTRLIELPGGTFEIGSNSHTDYEKPAHEVKIAPFAIEETEVTVAQYNACVAGGACSPAADSTQPLNDSREQVRLAQLFSLGCNGKHPERADHPITCVSWQQAVSYCHWIGRRLPTEEEWEHAARDPDGRFWVWGSNENPTFANVRDASLWKLEWGQAVNEGADDGYQLTAPVGSFSHDTSANGVKDLMGNVQEWTASPAGKYSGKDQIPMLRIVRGNSWYSYGVSSGGVGRTPLKLARQTGDLGFRCAKGQDLGSDPIVNVPPKDRVPGYCEDDKDCVPKKEGCWENRCIPCRQVCKNQIRQAAQDHADDQYQCYPGDGSCRQTQREISNANNLMAHVAFATCLAELCGDESEFKKLPNDIH